jgi:hypothetical protein
MTDNSLFLRNPNKQLLRTPQGKELITAPTWNPSIGQRDRQIREAEAAAEFERIQAERRENEDPTTQRITVLEQKLERLTRSFEAFVNKTLSEGN